MQANSIRIEPEALATARASASDSDRSIWFNALLAEHGVKFLSSREQPDDVVWHVLAQDVELPAAWFDWFQHADVSFSADGYRSIRGLSFDFNQYGIAD